LTTCLIGAGLCAPMSAAAQAAPFCTPDQSPHFAFGFADLKSALGYLMGDPLECEHASSANGDSLQQTTTGLAIYHQSTNSPEFTDGWNHYMLGDQGVVAWTGDASPGAGLPAWGSPPPAASDASPPPSGPVSASAPPQPPAPGAEPPASPGGSGAPSLKLPPPPPRSATTCVDVGAGSCFNSAPELVDTVTLLAHTSTVTPLLRTAAKAGYVVHYGDLPIDVLGLFRPGGRDVILSTYLKSYPTLDRGPVMAHELQHVSDWLSQGPVLDTARGCLSTETNAFHTESSTWLELQGGHLSAPANDLEREFNMITQAITTDPAGFVSRLTIVYHDQCTGN
jgi:hypothetical protein